MERLSKEFALDVEWRPFVLHPEISPEGMTPEQLFGTRRHGDDYMGMLRREGESEGLEIKPPALISNSVPSLEAAEFARDEGDGLFDRLHRRLFESYFSDGEDIGSYEVLVRLGEECGAAPEALAAALTDGRYRGRVREGMDWAQRSGITGTPTFIFDDRFMLVGAQAHDVFQKITERILKKRAEGYPDS